MPARSRFPALVGGRVCLDFANTVGPRRPRSAAKSHDYVPDYASLVSWASHTGLVSARRQHDLTTDEARGTVAWDEALQLREAIYQVFSAVAQGEPTPADSLAVIQDAYLRALRNAHLAEAPGGLEWQWPDTREPEQLLWPIARSAIDLAVSTQLTRIKQCPGDDGQCGWLFLDTSKSATRRWCSMSTCGSRVKSQRQAERLRTSRAPD